MGLHNGLHSVIHEAPNADLTAFTYTKIYASAAATPTINGTAIALTAGTLIENVLVKSISSTANVFLFGSPINTTLGGGGVLGSNQHL